VGGTIGKKRRGREKYQRKHLDDRKGTRLKN
jgi:hypothetical protein